jgi:hypothetical protein
MSDEPEVVEQEDLEEVESPALRNERISKEFSNITSPTGPPAEPISDAGPDVVPVEEDEE